MRFAGFPSKRRTVQILVASLIALLIALFVSPKTVVKADWPTEYSMYVHTYIDSGVLGNWTYEEKPGFPVMINDSQIALGGNWSIVCPLLANHSYHVYCYGEWVDTGPDPRTNYDLYVYNHLGEMEGYHTASAGFPQHLGTNGTAFFVPKYTGNYTFVIVNDLKESKAAQQATFMIMENVETDVWHEQYITGKGDDSLPVLNTSSAFDFATNNQAVQVFVNVPKTLDMYEARLYLMSDSASKNETILDGVPLAWEQGLYGVNSNSTNVIGGYNVESKEYRGNAYASCENYGQSMFMNFTAPNPGTNLYHLVFIGEVGYGTIDYMIKTEFNNTFLAPVSVPATAVPCNATIIAYASNLADLQNATLQYTNDSWTTANTVDMNVLNRICNATIPGQAAGTTVNYLITAEDTLENSLNATGSYPVKYLSTLNLTSIPIEPRLGDNVTLKGSMDPQAQGVPIIISVSSANETQQIQCYTLENGTFEANFKPDTAGSWFAYAEFNGSSSMIESESLPLTIRVGEPLSTQYAFYILGGAGAATAIGLMLYLRRIKS